MTNKRFLTGMLAVALVFGVILAGCETVSGFLDRGTSQIYAIDLSSGLWTSDFLKTGEARWYKFTASTETQYINLTPGTLIEIHDSWGRRYSRPSRIQIVSGSVYYVKVWHDSRSEKGVSIALRGSPSGGSSAALEPGGTPPDRSPDPATPSVPALAAADAAAARAAARDAPEPSPAAPPPPDITTEHWDVHDTATWIEAVGGIRNGGNNKAHIVTISGDISVPVTPTSENTFGGGTNITVTLEGSGSLSPSSANANLLRVGEGQTVVVKDITLQGRDDNEGEVVMITGGTFIMEDRAKITGNKKKGDGGGVYVDGGTFLMKDDSAVSGNSVSNSSVRAGGVYVDRGTFTMQGNAAVSNNADTGVYVGGTFTMKGKASVSGNTDSGVYIGYEAGLSLKQGTFIMQDNAAVSGNTADKGGGVHIGAGTFTMRDNATVSGNSATSTGSYDGGGACLLGVDYSLCRVMPCCQAILLSQEALYI